MADQRSAASQIYPHLPSAQRPEVEQRAQSLASAMWPSLAPKPKPAPNPYRESLLRNLRELSARVDARLQREGRRRCHSRSTPTALFGAATNAATRSRSSPHDFFACVAELKARGWGFERGEEGYWQHWCPRHRQRLARVLKMKAREVR
jgi:hypothetical protein